MRTAICLSGLARTFHKTHALFMRNVVEPFRARGQVDIFISIWDSPDLNALSARAVDGKASLNLNEIAALYKPIAMEVESFDSVKDIFQLNRYTQRQCLNHLMIKDGVLLSIPAQYKVLRCNELKRVYEWLNGFQYDCVVRTRLDFEIASLRIDELDLTKVNVLYDHDGTVGDYFYIANSANMDKVCRVFRNYPYLLNLPDTDMGPERNLKHHLVHEGLETLVLKDHDFALIKDTFRQEFRWNGREQGYRPYTPMIICSALYYLGSFARGDVVVRDGRFHPSKYSETFPLWYQYIRKHYPKDHLVLFCDTASPVPIQPLLDALPEPYDTFTGNVLPIERGKEGGPLIHVKWLTAHAGKYFHPMQRNLVEAILTAHDSGENLFWLDNDAFLNTDIRPQVRDAMVVASNAAHHQFTMDSVCFYIASKRLHALEELGIDLPAYLDNMVTNAPFDTRMHSLQEGGLYKTFWYGDARAIPNINLGHLNCLPRLIEFLFANPLDSQEYRFLLGLLESFDLTRLPPGTNVVFQDMLHSEERGRIPT